jgi:hypothetical protein
LQGISWLKQAHVANKNTYQLQHSHALQSSQFPATAAVTQKQEILQELNAVTGPKVTPQLTPAPPTANPMAATAYV